MKKESTYLILLTAIYFTVSLVGILHHELWLDEAHHYLLARDSNSFLDLIRNTRHEGHPIFWDALLYGISRFSLNPFWMQFLHILIATSVVFIFLRKAPFNWIFKTLFIFGYFMLFEYNLISRNYMLGVLFLFLACAVFEKRKEKFVLLSFYLVIAANVHLMFAVISFALFLTLLRENFLNKQFFNRAHFLGYLIFGFGTVLLIVQLIPSNSGWFFPTLENIPLSEKFTKGFISLFKGLITIPDVTSLHFWNSNLLVTFSKPLTAVLGLLIYIVPLLLFFKNRTTLFFVYSALIGVQIFFYITQRGATRFDGITYIIIIMALWIERYFGFDDYKLKDYLNSVKAALFQKPIVYGILIIHFFSGCYAYAMDFNYPFTASKATVDYLKKKNLNTKEIISISCDGTSISPYLEKKVYFLCDNSYQSYCHWSFDCAANITQQTITQMLTDYMENHKNAIYVSNYSIGNQLQPNVWAAINDKVKVRFLKKFDHNIIRNSYYYVFEVSKI